MAVDVKELCAQLKCAVEALGQAYNHVAPSTNAVLCVAEGRILSALETAEEALNLAESMS